MDIGLQVKGNALFGDSSQDEYDSGGEQWRGGFKDGFVQGIKNGAKARGSTVLAPQFEVRGSYDYSSGGSTRPNSRWEEDEFDGSGGYRPGSQGSMGRSSLIITSADDGSSPLSRSGSSPQFFGGGKRQSGLQLSPGVKSGGSAGQLPLIGVVGAKGGLPKTKSQNLPRVDPGPQWRRKSGSQAVPFTGAVVAGPPARRR